MMFFLKQLKINFDDSATSTYEYPSEQSLIDSMPPEPGDADYPTGGEQNGKAPPSSSAVLNRSKLDSGPPPSNASSLSSTGKQEGLEKREDDKEKGGDERGEKKMEKRIIFFSFNTHTDRMQND